MFPNLGTGINTKCTSTLRIFFPHKQLPNPMIVQFELKNYRDNLDGGLHTLMDLLTGVGVVVTSLLPAGEGETTGFSFTSFFFNLLVLVLDLPTSLEVLKSERTGRRI